MDKIYAEVGTRIRARRQRLELSLDDVSDLCGIHPAYIGQIERGVKKCSVQSVGALAKALGVSPATFFAPAATDGATMGQLIDAAARGNNTKEKKIMLDVLRRLARSLKDGR